jgi:putative membrane protein
MLDPGDLRRAWPLGLGILLLVGLWSGPLPELSGRAFSAHMLLHLGIVAVASPLVAIGLIRCGLREEVFRPLAAYALLASFFDLFVIWGWHAPVLHEAAARHDSVFVVQQISFLMAGALVWTVALGGRSRGAVGLGVLAMLMTFMHMTMLGVLLALAPDLLYAPDVCIGAFGFEKLEDQQLGGILMAVFGGFSYLAGALALVWRVLAGPERPNGSLTANEVAQPRGGRRARSGSRPRSLNVESGDCGHAEAEKPWKGSPPCSASQPHSCSS